MGGTPCRRALKGVGWSGLSTYQTLDMGSQNIICNLWFNDKINN